MKRNTEWRAVLAVSMSVVLWGVAELRAAPAESPAGVVTFSDPMDAYAKWYPTTNPAAIRSAAVDYLKKIVDGPADASPFLPACRNLTLIWETQGMPKETIIPVYVKQIGVETNPAALYTAATALSAAYVTLKDYGNAAKALESFLTKNASFGTPDNSVLAAQTLASHYADKLGQPKDAVAMLDREIGRLPTNAVPQLAALLGAEGNVCIRTLKDSAKAEAAYARVVGLGSQVPMAALVECSMNLAKLYGDTARPDKAVLTLLDLLRNLGLNPSGGAVQRLIDYGADARQLEEAARILEQRICENAASVAAVEMFQPDIVKLLATAGRPQAALQEARVFYLSASDKTFPAAIDLVAATFKTTDHNLGRANLFLKCQKYGPAGEDAKPGTADDMRDPLKDVPPLTDEERGKLCRLSMAGVPMDWQGYGRWGEVYLYQDRPVDAFGAFRKSFEVCPMTTNELQSATDRLTGLIVRCTRDTALAGNLVDYIMFGTAGKDGKEGTADDLKDPGPEIAKRLQYGPDANAAVAKEDEPAKPAAAVAKPPAS